MGTSDLLAELSKDSFRATPDVERKVTEVVLKQLDDQSADVSSLAIKCIPPLVKGASEKTTETVIDALCAKLAMTAKSDAQRRDAGVIGLKSLVAELGDSHPASGAVAASLAPKLVAFFAGKSTDEPDAAVVGDVLDILRAAATSHGRAMAPHHAATRDALLAYLRNDGRVAKKRAAQCLAALAASFTDAAAASTVDDVLGELNAHAASGSVAAKGGGAGDESALWAWLLGALARCAAAAGLEFSRSIARAAPMVADVCERCVGEEEEPTREACLQALEAFAARCPGECAVHLARVQTLALDLTSYDPNCDESDEGDDESDDGGDDNNGGDDDNADEDMDDDEYGDEEYSDDEDDSSWKIRRAAVKTVAAASRASPAILEANFEKIASKMLGRLRREREESVKLDVFEALEDIIATCAGHGGTLEAAARACAPRIARAATARLVDANAGAKTKTAAIRLTRETAAALPGSLESSLPALVPAFASVLAPNGPSQAAGGSALKVEALALASLVFSTRPADAPTDPAFVDSIAPHVFAAAGDKYYKVAAEALRACRALVPVVARDARWHAAALAEAAMSRVGATDQDQEVKDAAISCAGAAAARLGDVMGASDLKRCLGLLLDRLKNEITRLAAVKAIGQVAKSELRLDMGDAAASAVEALAGFLRKTNRPLRQASLAALEALVSKHSGSLSDAEVTAAVVEAAALVTDGDLAIAGSALSLAASSVKVTAFPTARAAVCERTLPAALELVRSPLMQSHALHALTSFFAALVAANLPGSKADDLLERLMDPSNSGAGVAGGGSLKAEGEAAAVAGRTAAVCVAAVCAGVNDAKHTSATATALVKQLGDPASLSEKDLPALFCLGELGKAADLSAVAGIEAALLGALDAPGEELKSAASVALGGVATGGRAKFLPIILGHVANESHKHQYSLFLSLREVIRDGGGGGEEDEQRRMLEILFANAGSEEEGVRNVVAECLGLLAVRDAASLAPRLAEKASTPGDARTRATSVLAMKYAALALGHSSDSQSSAAVFAEVLPAFVGSIPLRDEDRDVRRAAVQTLSAAAHAAPALARPILADALPAVFEQTVIDQSSVRVVDLGPFKHTVDDGLELRKAAFECCDTLLDACLPADSLANGGESVSGCASGYVAALVTGLGDHYDVKMVSHALLAKLATRPGASTVLLQRLKELVDPMGKTLTAKLKGDAVKQEIDRNEDLVRSCLRAVDACEAHLAGASNDPAFAEFIAKTVNGERTAAKYAAIKAEAKAADKE